MHDFSTLYLSAPNPDLSFFGSPTLAVTGDSNDPTRLVVDLSPAPGPPPAGVTIVTEYELTIRDQCEVVEACPVGVEEDHPSEITGLEANSDYSVSLYAIDQCRYVIATPLTASATTSGKTPIG